MAEKIIQDIRQQQTRRGITLTLTPGVIINGIAVLCIGFILVFTLGVLLGRGYDLENAIPGLERVMPDPASTAPPEVISTGGPPVSRNAQPIAQEARIPESRSNTTAGTPSSTRDLEQAGLGAQENGKPAAQEKIRPQTTGKNKSTEKAKPSEKTAPRQLDNVPAKPAAAAPTKNTTPASGQGATTTPSGKPQVYRYTYQVAAYKDQPSCDKFVAVLKKGGFQARAMKTTDSGVIWYRAMIDFTGQPDDTDALRASLKKQGIPRVILKSKTPVR